MAKFIGGPLDGQEFLAQELPKQIVVQPLSGISQRNYLIGEVNYGARWGGLAAVPVTYTMGKDGDYHAPVHKK